MYQILGTKRLNKKKIETLSKQAKDGNVDAMFELGYYFLDHDWGIAATWLQKAADKKERID